MKRQPISDPSEQEVFALADNLSWGTFHLPEREADRTRLQELASKHWALLDEKSQVQRIAYLFRLLLTCPILLDQPQGFEWIVKTLQWELAYRKYNPKTDQDFWEAVSKVRGILRIGRPAAKAKDVATALEIYRLTKEEGLAVTAAVERLAEVRGGRSDTSAIWRALHRFERERARLDRWQEQIPKSFIVGDAVAADKTGARSSLQAQRGTPRRKGYPKGRGRDEPRGSRH